MRFVCACVSHQKQKQHHVGMVAHARYMQSRPQVFVLQVDVQASLQQHLRRQHVVMTSALRNVWQDIVLMRSI